MDQDRPLEPGLRLELGEQPVDVVDVPGALDLGDHDHVELVADLGDERGQVVEDPGALERVDPGPERGLPEVGLLRRLDQARPGPPPCGPPGSRPRGCRAGCRSARRCRAPWRPSSRWRSRGSGSSAKASPGSPRAAPGRRSPCGCEEVPGVSHGGEIYMGARAGASPSARPFAAGTAARLRAEMAFSDDRGSTQDWLLPEDRDSGVVGRGRPVAGPARRRRQRPRPAMAMCAPARTTAAGAAAPFRLVCSAVPRRPPVRRRARHLAAPGRLEVALRYTRRAPRGGRSRRPARRLGARPPRCGRGPPRVFVCGPTPFVPRRWPGAAVGQPATTESIPDRAVRRRRRWRMTTQDAPGTHDDLLDGNG